MSKICLLCCSYSLVIILAISIESIAMYGHDREPIQSQKWVQLCVFWNPPRVPKPTLCSETPHVYWNPPCVLKPPTCTETPQVYWKSPTCTETHHMCRNPHVYWNPPRVLKPPTCTETPQVYRNPSRVPKPPTCTETQPSGGLARVNRRFCN